MPDHRGASRQEEADGRHRRRRLRILQQVEQLEARRLSILRRGTRTCRALRVSRRGCRRYRPVAPRRRPIDDDGRPLSNTVGERRRAELQRPRVERDRRPGWIQMLRRSVTAADEARSGRPRSPASGRVGDGEARIEEGAGRALREVAGQRAARVRAARELLGVGHAVAVGIAGRAAQAAVMGVQAEHRLPMAVEAVVVGPRAAPGCRRPRETPAGKRSGCRPRRTRPSRLPRGDPVSCDP